MPFLRSPYQAPFGFHSGHVQTVYPTLFRRLPHIRYQRQKLELRDGDFLDLDVWRHAEAEGRSKRPLALLAHGMEGSSQAIYMRGMALALFAAGFDIMAWNMRGCGGGPNRLPSFYHSGKTDDLRAVIAEGLKTHARYALVGFSLGGNVVLKHMGEVGKGGEANVGGDAAGLGREAAGLLGAVAISVPVDLAGCAARLERPENFIYQKRFLLSFRSKIRAKAAGLPGQVSEAPFRHIRTLRDFDNAYTAPDFGYADAEAYWSANASLAFLPAIDKPTLLLTSADDPFLSPSCYPRDLAAHHPHFIFEEASQGGHCGFVRFNRERLFYAEARARDFLSGLV